MSGIKHLRVASLWPSFQGVAAQAPSEEEESGTVLMKIAQSLGFFIGKARRRCNINIFAGKKKL